MVHTPLDRSPRPCRRAGDAFTANHVVPCWLVETPGYHGRAPGTQGRWALVDPPVRQRPQQMRLSPVPLVLNFSTALVASTRPTQPSRIAVNHWRENFSSTGGGCSLLPITSTQKVVMTHCSAIFNPQWWSQKLSACNKRRSCMISSTPWSPLTP